MTLLENITIRIWKADVALLCHVYQEGKKKAITQESLQPDRMDML